MRTIIILLLLISFSETVHAQSVLFAAKEKGKKFGYIDEKGAYKIEPAFDDAGAFYHDRAVVKKGKKFGLIDTKGNLVVKAEYDGIESYAPDGKFTVTKAGKWGVIDGTGKTIIPLKYNYLSVMKNGLVVGGQVLKEYFKGNICPFVLNEKSDTLFIQLDCSDMPSFLSVKAEKGKFYYSAGWPLVEDGFVILESPNWEDSEGPKTRSIVRLSNQELIMLQNLTIVDKQVVVREGRIAVNHMVENSFVSGRYLDTLMLGGDFTYQDAFELQAQTVYPFFNGVAAAERDGMWIFLDREGWVISKTNLSTEEYKAGPPMYYNGLIGLFNSQDKAGYVDIKGNVVIPFQFEEYHPFEYEITPVKYNGQYGLLKKDGSWAAQPKFEKINPAPCPCFQ